MGTLVKFTNVSLGYSKRRPVLSGLNFKIDSGQYIGLVGANGMGKSTLLKAVIGALAPQEGTVEFFDAQGSPVPRLESLGYMPQRQTLDVSYPLSVFDTVLMGRYAQMKWRLLPSAEDREAVAQALEQVKIGALSGSHISALSGGQLQRVLMARAIVSRPSILILDEPTNGMDPGASEDTLDIVDRLHKDGMTVVIVTHMLEIVARKAQQAAVLYTGDDGATAVQWGDPKEILNGEYLSRLYGRPIAFNTAEDGADARKADTK